MGTGDGTVQGLTNILNNGPNNSRLNIVLVAEGFQASEQANFNTLCADFVAALQAENWYPVLGDAINVHRLNVASNDSGADQPATCADGHVGPGTYVNTYFDATFCNSGLWRCLAGDPTLVHNELDAALPQWNFAVVLVNTTQHGGCAGGNICFTCIEPGWENVALHEMGHTFGLGDEYHYWQGCGSGETGHDNAPTYEPSNDNITTETNRADLKWRHLCTPGVPIPTMENPNCTQCDNRPNILDDDDSIGLFEGAQYYHCGRFRPAYRCRMRTSGASFCRVCIEAIAARVANYVPPTPVMDVLPTTLNFGDVGLGLTLYLSFEVRNIRSGHPGAININVSAPTGGFAYAPGTETDFTLAAPVLETYTVRRVYVSFTAPNTPGSFSSQITIRRTDDPSSPTVTVTLQAAAVAPVPVDSVLVLDRSGSMVEETGVVGVTKSAMLIDAAKLYVSLLKDNDGIGVVRYNHHSDASDRLLGVTTAGLPDSGAGRVAARGVLTPANFSPAGTTSIGAGIINGSAGLDTGTAGARALVVVTDGRQNTDPDIPEGTSVVLSKIPRQRVFAVGLGLNQLEDKLEQIASFTAGTAQITGELVDDREFLLQKLFVQILSDVSDEAFVHDPVRVALPGEKQATSFFICEVDVAADFILVFRRASYFPKYLRVELEAPDGARYTPSSMAGMANVQRINGETYLCYRWQFPITPSKPRQHCGEWRLWIENLYRERGQGPRFIYSAMCKTRSGFRLAGQIVQSGYSPGTVMEIVLEPTLHGLPVGLDSPVVVQLTRPEGGVRAVALDRSEDGLYRGQFSDTAQVGRYLAAAEVFATTPAGYRVTRFRQMTGIIFPPGSGTGHGPNAEMCREAKAALERLNRLISRCCAGVEGKQQMPEDRKKTARNMTRACK